MSVPLRGILDSGQGKPGRRDYDAEQGDTGKETAQHDMDTLQLLRVQDAGVVCECAHALAQ